MHRTSTTHPLAPQRALLLSLLCGTALPATAFAQSTVDILDAFDMAEVQITDEYYESLFTKDIEYLLRLDADRLLAGFEAVSRGQDPANGVTLYGGWEGGWSLLRGHSMGHYLTALAQAYKKTEGVDPELNSQIADRLDNVVAQLQSYQTSSGYLFASLESHFDVVEGKISGDMWVPWYTMHKILAGLVDTYRLRGSETALEVAGKLGDWIYRRASAWDSSTHSRVLGVEYGGMNDCLYELYKCTESADHLAAAHLFDEDSLFEPISRGTDVLNGKHANTQFPKFVGALNRYRVLGSSEESYLTSAEQFWDIVTRSHTYVTGGNSENEHFHEPGILDGYRDNTNNETCNSYNMLKLTRGLFMVTGDAKYADFYERGYINEIISSINPETGMTTYFKPMGTGYFKLFGRETDTFWCCTGTGMENFTKLNDSIYFHNENQVYVNLYVSSVLNWDERLLSFTQTADVPLSARVTFTINSAPPDEMGILFRKPYWLAVGQSATILVNGQQYCAPEVNGYFDVQRVWNAGDTVELTLPADVRVSRLPDDNNAVAFTYGPLVLSAGLGTERMEKTTHLASEKATIPAGVVIDETVGINSSTTIEEWIAKIKDNLVQTPGELEFKPQNTDSDTRLVFTPHYRRYTDRYGIYFQLEGNQGTASGVGGSGTGGGTSSCEPLGGATGSGGTNNVGGEPAGGGVDNAGGQVTDGGAANSGGQPGSGGTSQAGSIGAGGAPQAGGGNVGGLTSSGGVASVGGGSGAGTAGAVALGGSGGLPPGTGGRATGGAFASGGAANRGGSAGVSVAAGGVTPPPTGGSGSPPGTGGNMNRSGTAGNMAGTDALEGDPSDDDSGCGCRVEGHGRAHTSWLLVSAGLLWWTRRQRARSAQRTRHLSSPTVD